MTCPRLFEVEANRDGRLAGAERASFARHLATCAECRAETNALADLGALARARTEAPDDLRARRAARQLLRKFNAELTEPPPRGRAWLAVPALLVAALIALRLVPRAAPAQVATPDPASASALHVEAAGAAVPPVAGSDSASSTATPPAAPAPLPSSRPIAESADAGAAANPAAEYRAAVAKLQAGDDRAAALAFQQFTAKYPTHESAEDAAYLRVVALDHAGDRPATEAAAGDYLTAHPTGFRRPEVEKLLRR